MSDWLPSLNALRAFEAVARHLGYRPAADELNVSPAAVNQLVRKLETALGTRLLERKGRGLALTEKGETAARELSQAFRQISRCVDDLRRTDPGNRLVVTSDPSFAALWLVPRLERFKAGNPDVDVLLDASPQIADLAHGAADIAVRFGTFENTSLITHRLFDEVICAYCSPALTRGDAPLRQIEDLERLPLLRWDLGQYRWASTTAQWNRWTHWLACVGAAHIRPGRGPRFNDYNLAVQAAIAGHGVLLGSRPILRDLVDAGLLVAPLPEAAATDIGYDLVVTPEARARSPVSRFRDWIIAEAQQ